MNIPPKIPTGTPPVIPPSAPPQVIYVVQQPPPRKKSSWVAGCLVVLFAGFFFLVIIPIVLTIGLTPPKSPNQIAADAAADAERNASFDAYFYAEEFCKENLKAPTTAKFSDSDDRKAGARRLNDSKWLVWGYVDSQNSFGAMLHEDWTVVLRKSGGHHTLLYLRIGGTVIGNYESASNTNSP